MIIAALEARLAECEREREAIEEVRKFHTKLANLQTERAEAAEARAQKLEEALGMVEWVYDAGDGINTECPWCRGDYPEHVIDCQRQAALRDEAQ